MGGEIIITVVFVPLAFNTFRRKGLRSQKPVCLSGHPSSGRTYPDLHKDEDSAVEADQRAVVNHRRALK